MGITLTLRAVTLTVLQRKLRQSWIALPIRVVGYPGLYRGVEPLQVQVDKLRFSKDVGTRQGRVAESV